MKMEPSDTFTDDFIVLGKITKPHGIRGEVKIFPLSGQPENFKKYKTIYLAFAGEDKDPVTATIEKCRVQGKLVLVKMAEYNTRNDAETLVGRLVLIPSSDLPELSSEEYYLSELQGKKAVTSDGLEIGNVVGILETGAHDILVVQNNEQEFLIPAHKKFLVNWDENQIVLDLPPGLLEINKSQRKR